MINITKLFLFFSIIYIKVISTAPNPYIGLKGPMTSAVLLSMWWVVRRHQKVSTITPAMQPIKKIQNSL